jgi:hypothetical protein
LQGQSPWAFHSERPLFACHQEQGEIAVWNLETGERICEMSDLGRPVQAMRFVSDASRLLSMSTAGLTIWSIAARTEMFTIPLPEKSGSDREFESIVASFDQLERDWKEESERDKAQVAPTGDH